MKQQKMIIPIDKDLYLEFKDYCKANGYIIKSTVEKLIKYELSKNLFFVNRESKKTK